MTDRLGRRLLVTLEAARIGVVLVRVNLQLTRYDEGGWRATFSSGAQFDQTGLGALVDHADRFVYVSGWPWRTLRGMLRKARPGA